MGPESRRAVLNLFLTLVLISLPPGCTDTEDSVVEGRAGQGDEPALLFRAPAISNLVDGVVWEAGNWEPHLGAGDEGVSWGNHRAVVVVPPANGPEQDSASADAVDEPTAAADAAATLANAPMDAVSVTIPWRRRDADPASKGIVVVDAATGQVVPNTLATRIENESGDVVFQPNPGSNEYHVYYMPWQSSGGYYPTITYPSSAELRDAGRRGGTVGAGVGETVSRVQGAEGEGVSWAGLVPDPDPAWERMVWNTPGQDLPRATTTHIQSVNEFHSFFPMEVIASPQEAAALVDDDEWALIPEHRDYPIRMKHFLPRHWTDRGAGQSTFTSQVLRDEAFTFQLGVVSGVSPLGNLTVSFQGFPPALMESMTCFNCQGTNERGLPFSKTVDVAAETVQPLWIGVRIPEDRNPGLVEGSVTVSSSDRGAKTVTVSLDVLDAAAPNGGTDAPELQTRLAWLNSTVGTDPDFIIEPFVPVRLEEPVDVALPERPTDSAGSGGSSHSPGPSLSILGRRVELGPAGLPAQIYSYFTPELTDFADEPEPILARPLNLRVITPGTHLEEFVSSPFQVRQEARGSARWTAESTSDYLEMKVEGTLEYDGMLDLRIELVARSDAAVDDIGLPVALVPDAAEYMLGLGRKGGKRPAFLDWKWAVENHQEGVWLGGVHKGLQYVLRDENYVRPLNTNFYRNQPLNMPPSWFNEGQGGIRILEEEGSVTAYNYSGPRTLLEGDTLHFNVRFLITPFKPINTEDHFGTRFVHQYVPVDSVRSWGGTVVNIHHANEINPYINYPFFSLDQQAAYINEAHEKGIKVKLYNTIRELTYKAHELFAMRSLGDEILNKGEGGGHSWMQEHLEDDYHSAWHAWRTDDAAMLNKGTSRWTNYYIEGINWLAANQEIDGLYLDDIAFSRETVKRIVTVLDQNRPEVVIDLHSANQFNVRDGFTNSAMLYMEHFPFISRLWFGEYFEYGLDEDYWMTEVSGLPFGLMGEMLQDGGHPYRGMLYGMTARKYGDVDPRPIWAMMNDFGIGESRMLGYWLADAPVTTDHPRVLATTYVREGAILVALASWSEEDVVVNLSADWVALGLEDETQPGVRAYAPAVEGIQPGGEVDRSAITVPAGQGLFVIVDRVQ